MQQSIITVFEEPERTSLDRIQAYTKKAYIISSKRERSFLRNFFVICEFHSQRYSLVLRKQFANTLSWNLRREIWEPLGVQGEKGNILR